MQILFFGVLKEKTGTDKLDMEFSGSLGDLKAQLKKLFPLLENQDFSLAVNRAIQTDEKLLLNPSDIVALLPPFSGG